MGDQPDAKPLPTQDNTDKEKTQQTSILWVGFEPTILWFDLAKAFHALDDDGIVTGLHDLMFN
jgi:hypothetical protein